jgi:hypothetical protein
MLTGRYPKGRTLLESLRVKGFPNRSEGVASIQIQICIDATPFSFRPAENIVRDADRSVKLPASRAFPSRDLELPGHQGVATRPVAGFCNDGHNTRPEIRAEALITSQSDTKKGLVLVKPLGVLRGSCLRTTISSYWPLTQMGSCCLWTWYERPERSCRSFPHRSRRAA